MSAPKKILKPICRKCGSDNIACDATAAWNVDTGAWELAGENDNAQCQDCGYDSDYMPWVMWEGGPRGKWVVDPDDGEPLDDAVLARLNDGDAVNPGFVYLSPEPAPC